MLCFVTWFLSHYGKQARFRPYTVTRVGEESCGLCKLCHAILSWRSLAVEETGQREASLDGEDPPYIKIQGTICRVRFLQLPLHLSIPSTPLVTHTEKQMPPPEANKTGSHSRGSRSHCLPTTHADGGGITSPTPSPAFLVRIRARRFEIYPDQPSQHRLRYRLQQQGVHKPQSTKDHQTTRPPDLQRLRNREDIRPATHGATETPRNLGRIRKDSAPSDQRKVHLPQSTGGIKTARTVA